MGARGFAAKPTAVRILEGNPGKRPINPDEPKPTILEKYEAPEDLPERGKIIWDALSAELQRLGLLSIVDLEPFHRYIKFLLEYHEMDSKIEGKYVITVKNPDGSVKYVMQNPYISIRNKAAIEMSRLEQQFGMTPSARARMIGFLNGNAKPKEVLDPYDL